MSAFKAALVTGAVALLFATGGAAIKASDFGPWQIASSRSLVAFLVLFALAPSVRRPWSLRVLILGVPYAAVMVLFVHANGMAKAGTVTLLQATAPLYVLLLAPWLLGERVRLRRLLPLPLFALGLGILLSAPETPTAIATDPALGRWLAAIAGLSFGLVLLGLSAAENGDGEGVTGGAGLQAVAWGNLLASLVSLPFALSAGTTVTPLDLSISVYLGVLQIAIPYLLLLPAMRVLPAYEVSLILLLEPLGSPLFAWLIHGEELSGAMVAGGLTILAACALQTLIVERAPGVDTDAAQR